MFAKSAQHIFGLNLFHEFLFYARVKLGARFRQSRNLQLVFVNKNQAGTRPRRVWGAEASLLREILTESKSTPSNSRCCFATPVLLRNTFQYCTAILAQPFTKVAFDVKVFVLTDFDKVKITINGVDGFYALRKTTKTKESTLLIRSWR